jgi:hypothetical protein
MRPKGLLFADQVPAALGADSGRMGSSSGDIAAVARAIGSCLAIYCQRHFPGQDNVGGIARVGVIGVESVGIVLPCIGVGEALRAKLFRKRVLVHECMKPQLAGNTNWLQVSAWQLRGLTMRRASRTLGLRAPSFRSRPRNE